MATIRKRGNLQWEARIRKRGYPTTGKTFETKADAEAWARQIESEMDRGILFHAQKQKIPLLTKPWSATSKNTFHSKPTLNLSYTVLPPSKNAPWQVAFWRLFVVRILPIS